MYTYTHIFGCSVASTFWEEKSNIIFLFEPHFVVQWNHNSAFYKITAKRDNVMQDGLKSTWTSGSHGDHWWLLSLEMWHTVLWKQGTISEEDWYLIFHTTHIPREQFLVQNMSENNKNMCNLYKLNVTGEDEATCSTSHNILLPSPTPPTWINGYCTDTNKVIWDE